MNAAKLTNKPTLLTALLSALTIAGYAGFRLTSSAPEEPSRFANELPEIVFEDLAGVPTPLSNWAGKPLLVNFWATWCAPCLREIPLLKTFHGEHDSIDVIGIAVDRTEPVLDFVANEMQFNYPVLIGQATGYDAMAFFRNDAQVMPFTAFTSAEGAVLGVHYGELHQEHLENFARTVDRLEIGEIDLKQAREQIADLGLDAAH